MSCHKGVTVLCTYTYETSEKKRLATYISKPRQCTNLTSLIWYSSNITAIVLNGHTGIHLILCPSQFYTKWSITDTCLYICINFVTAFKLQLRNTVRRNSSWKLRRVLDNDCITGVSFEVFRYSHLQILLINKLHCFIHKSKIHNCFLYKLRNDT